MTSISRLSLLVTIVVATSCARKAEVSGPVTTTIPAASAPSTGQNGTDHPTPAPAVGEVTVGSLMPPFSSKYLDGKPFELAGEKGHVVFLNLWATWCGPCRYEIPELQALHDKRGPEGLRVIGVSLDESGPAPVGEFVTQHKMTYPIVLDPEGRLASALQASVIPTSVVLDRGGKVVWKKFGVVSMSDASLMGAIDKAMAAR